MSFPAIFPEFGNISLLLQKKLTLVFFQPDYVRASFDWLGNFKSGGSMFLAVSPEMDLALYTICFLARPNQVCTVR